MRSFLADILKGIRYGKTNKKELSLLIKAINKTKKNKEILESIHAGSSSYRDKELEWLADLLGKSTMI